MLKTRVFHDLEHRCLMSPQEIMSRGLGIPATQHAFEDVALQLQAIKMNLNPEVGRVALVLVGGGEVTGEIESVGWPLPERRIDLA